MFFSHIDGKLLETFWMIWLNIGLHWKITEIRTTFFLVSYPKQIQYPKRGIVFTVLKYEIILEVFIRQFIQYKTD